MGQVAKIQETEGKQNTTTQEMGMSKRTDQ